MFVKVFSTKLAHFSAVSSANTVLVPAITALF
jgi:hypothetical protein